MSVASSSSLPASHYSAPSMGLHDSTASRDTSPDALLQHLLNSKRSLSSINDVWRANEICNSTRQAIENSAVTLARDSFLRNGVTSQLGLLRSAQHGLQTTVGAAKTEFDATIRDLDDANERLKETLHSLRGTMVEARLRPEEEERRNLMSFVDEQSVEKALSETKALIQSAGAEISSVEKVFRDIQSDLAHIDDLVAFQGGKEEASKVVRSAMPELLQEMDEHAREMATNLESLVTHFDLCVTAIKHVEGGGDAASKIAIDLPDGFDIDKQDVQPLSAEEKKHMMAVLEEDAGQVDDVVLEIKQHIAAMEVLFEQGNEHVDVSEKTHLSTAAAFKSLEAMKYDIGDFLRIKQAFLQGWEKEKGELDAKVEELEGLREFYEGFLHAYDNLIIEIGRRKAFEARMDKLVHEATSKIDKLFEDDLEEREGFKKEQGDFLPVDIWPGLMSPPMRYHVLQDESTLERVPDISKSVIHAAIRRVHGNQ